MHSEYFEFDPEEDVLRFKKESSAQLLCSLLVAAKFGDHHDYRVLLNPIYSGLVKELKDGLAPRIEAKLNRLKVKPRAVPSAGFGRELMTSIGNRIVEYSGDIGWWKKTHEERVDFIQSVIACPHTFSEADVEIIFETIELRVRLAKQLIEICEAQEA